MEKCKSCKKEEGIYHHNDGGIVCEKCVGSYFNCPDCGLVFDQDDRENGDQASGFCKICTPNH